MCEEGRRARILSVLEKDGGRAHFIGVGGVSMSALAAWSVRLGLTVSGSDREMSRTLSELCMLGVKAYSGHRPEMVADADIVIYSLAIGEGDEELRLARKSGTLTVSRAEYLGTLMLRYKTRIGVSGTHGKSSVTAMLGSIFSTSYRHPTVLCGASISNNRPYVFGGEDVLIYEACEYRRAFLSFSPSIALILNVDFDHPDCYRSIEDVEDAFIASARGAELSVVNIDSAAARRVFSEIGGKKISVGKSDEADYRYEALGDGAYPEFNIYHLSRRVASLKLSVIGEHNAANATAAFAVANEYGITQKNIISSLECFSGLERRGELLGRLGDSFVYYDYAHHPSEIRASIKAVRALGHKHVTVLFKPHTYTRTAALWDDFKSALSMADRVILTEIYPAREEPIQGITSERLAEEIGGRASFYGGFSALDALFSEKRGAIILMGAGNMAGIVEKFLGDENFSVDKHRSCE